MTHGAYVTVEADTLVVRRRKIEICRRPLGETNLIFLQGIGRNVSVALACACAERDVSAELGFERRATRGATDPVNQAINYVYGMLYGEVWRALAQVGLDPYFGLMHGSERDQGSLVFDLIEEFRAPFADRLVLAMIGRGMRPEVGPHGFLRTRIRRLLAQAFVRAWTTKIRRHGRMIAPSGILQQQAGALVKLITGQAEDRPFRMRW